MFPSSGRAVTTDDVIWTIERAFALPSGPAWVWGNIGLHGMDQVERVDEQTLILHDIRPSTIVLPLMRDQSMGVIDAAAVAANSTDDDPWGANLAVAELRRQWPVRGGQLGAWRQDGPEGQSDLAGSAALL